MGFDHEGRIGRLRTVMAEQDIDATLLSVGPDLPYFTGYEAMASERLTMLAVPSEGTPVLVIPQLEAPRVDPGPFELVSWSETEDPVAMVSKTIAGSARLAIGDHTRSSFLIDLQRTVGASEWIPASELTRHLRMVKDSGELDALRTAARQTDRVAERMPSEITFGGSAERAVALQVRELLIDEGHDLAEFAIVGSGSNSASPHHQPGDRVIEDGDVVVVDFGGSLRGYKSDTTRTFVVGNASVEAREVHAVVHAANTAGKAAVEPGAECADVDQAARAVVKDAGYGEYFIHRTGHGIGLEVHEHPYIVSGNNLQLELGMTFSVEPGIYLPGRFGVRIEDIVACAPDGVEELNRSPRDLIEVA